MSTERNDGTPWDHARYMADQCQEIQRHKWIESERAGRDLGQDAIIEWIRNYAPAFRTFAEQSGLYGTTGQQRPHS